MGTLHGGAGLQSVGRRSRSQTRMQVQRRARVGWTALRARVLHARLPNDLPETLIDGRHAGPGRTSRDSRPTWCSLSWTRVGGRCDDVRGRRTLNRPRLGEALARLAASLVVAWRGGQPGAAACRATAVSRAADPLPQQPAGVVHSPYTGPSGAEVEFCSFRECVACWWGLARDTLLVS